MNFRNPFAIMMILLLALMLAAPSWAAPPDPTGVPAIADVLNAPAAGVFAVQKTENVQEITFHENFTVYSYTAVKTAAILSVRTEFSLEYSENMLTGRKIGKTTHQNGDGVYRGQGGDELFSSGFIV